MTSSFHSPTELSLGKKDELVHVVLGPVNNGVSEQADRMEWSFSDEASSLREVAGPLEPDSKGGGLFVCFPSLAGFELSDGGQESGECF